jgi:transposase InsO family protein
MFDWLKLVQKEIKLNFKIIRLDNSGETRSFHQLIVKYEINIKSEFTAPGTPQQYGKVERAFEKLLVKKINAECSKIHHPTKKGIMVKLC